MTETNQIVALKNALNWFRTYHNGNPEAFVPYMAAFDYACGVTGWTDAAVLEWLKEADKQVAK